MSYLARRIGLYLVAAWASVTLAFVIPRLMPGDPAAAMFARFRTKMSPESMDALRRTFGFTNDPLPEQYVAYVGHVADGDLGISVSHFPAPVTDVISTALTWTLVLAGVAVVIAFAIGTLLGIAAAWRRSGWLDSVAPPVLLLLGAFPYFWLGMLLLWLFGMQLEWFPVRHAYGDDVSPGLSLDFLVSAVSHAILPGATIVIATLGGWMLDMRNTMITVLGEDYITLAHAKGLPPRRIMFRYAARNALLPNVTSFGMALGFVLSGSLLTEIIFSYPGTGYLLIKAVQSRDFPLIQGLFLTITTAVLVANLLVDLVYVWLDPRARRSR